MSERKWIPLVQNALVTEGSVFPTYPEGISVLLIRVEGALFALRNRCAHMSCVLSGGQLEGYLLRCPCHEWRFDVRTGAFVDAPEITIPTYDTMVQDDKIHICLENS